MSDVFVQLQNFNISQFCSVKEIKMLDSFVQLRKLNIGKFCSITRFKCWSVLFCLF